MTKKIYFAGPDVFDVNYVSHKEKIKQCCERLGFLPLLPADTEIQCTDKTQLAHLIYEQNIAYIREADLVVANVKPFRGHEPDSGTVFEIGFAVSQGKPVWCYHVCAQPLMAQIEQRQPGYDAAGNVIEDFGMPLNLMLGSSCHLFEGDVFDLLKKIS